MDTTKGPKRWREWGREPPRPDQLVWIGRMNEQGVEEWQWPIRAKALPPEINSIGLVWRPVAAKSGLAPGQKRAGARRKAPLAVTAKASPLVRDVLGRVGEVGMTVTELSRKSGATKESIYRWAKGHAPRLHDLEAVAGVLGVKIVVERQDGQGAK